MRKLLQIFRKRPVTAQTSHFSDFFLHASDEQKRKVFTEAAKRANEEQMEVFKKLHLKLETNG
ncbi:MAG: hypothetical protein HYV42_03965 [Candidatus Magasanikbacteria bacterium]|nr:hypothetical protein [Candidatus Magasanikbacteria bacterium]